MIVPAMGARTSSALTNRRSLRSVAISPFVIPTSEDDEFPGAGFLFYRLRLYAGRPNLAVLKGNCDLLTDETLFFSARSAEQPGYLKQGQKRQAAMISHADGQLRGTRLVQHSRRCPLTAG
jgi:hypothetical protein